MSVKKATKKILFVGAYPPPYGGIASHLYDLLPQLVKNNYEVVSLTQSLETRVISSLGMKNIFVNFRKTLLRNLLALIFAAVRYYKEKKDLSWREYLRAIILSLNISATIKQEKISAVFLYSITTGMAVPILKKMINNSCPIVLMIFGAFYLEPNKYKRISRYLFNVFEQCGEILSSSAYCARSISAVLSDDFPVKVVYVGVDDHVYSPNKTGDQLRSELGIPKEAIVFLFFGRMNKNMGLDFLLKKAKDIIAVHQDSCLIIAGAQSTLSFKAQELAQKYPKIKYCPDVSFYLKPAYYAACDVFFAPTMQCHACMGVSIKEAMACAKPVIASWSGGIPEAIEDGVNGYLIPIINGELDEKVFMERITYLFHQPLLRVEMGIKGREKLVENYSNEKTTQRYLDILNVLTKKQRDGN